MLLHKVCEHQDNNSANTVRALFLDYSSAFNCIQLHIMIQKLHDLDVPAHLLLWILDFLTSRSQYVCTSHEISSHITLNTGAPQGCVLSPILFVLYTNDLTWNSSSVSILKYADDTVIVGLVTNDDDDEYFRCIEFVTTWCHEAYLRLNVSKTQEIRWDFRKRSVDKRPVVIDMAIVQTTRVYKYLGLLIDKQLTFTDHVDRQCKKVQKRLFCVRSMVKLCVDPNIIALFFKATIVPVLLYACTVFFGLLSSQLRASLDKSRRVCKKVLKRKCNYNLECDLTLQHKSRALQLAKKIIEDSTHPLYKHFQMLPSGRRYCMPVCRTSRFRKTLIPTAINLLNS